MPSPIEPVPMLCPAYDREVVAWVAASCAAQGVPLHITDPVTLAQVGTLLMPAAGLGAPRPAAKTGLASNHPQGFNPVRVEPSATGGGADDCVVKDGPNNRRLPVKVQLRPRLA